jgi:hypothetical protein
MGDLGGLITCEKKFTRKGPVLDYFWDLKSSDFLRRSRRTAHTSIYSLGQNQQSCIRLSNESPVDSRSWGVNPL